MVWLMLLLETAIDCLLIHYEETVQFMQFVPHIVPHRKFDRIDGTSSATFPNFKYVAPSEIYVERNCFDRPVAK